MPRLLGFGLGFWNLALGLGGFGIWLRVWDLGFWELA